MGRQSIVDAWLGKFPKERQKELEQKIRSAPTIRVAYQELKNLKFRGSYDSVQTWRAKDAKSRSEGLSDQASKVTAMAARMPLESDPIASVMSLAQELNSLCMNLTVLLQRHEWLEAGEIRLSNREAVKILGALPSLARASAGSIVEMSRVKSELDQRSFALGIIEELSQDWQQSLGPDNPELIGLFESVARITKNRLELDRPSVLGQQIEDSESSVSSF
jgi:hypothetical protein